MPSEAMVSLLSKVERISRELPAQGAIAAIRCHELEILPHRLFVSSWVFDFAQEAKNLERREMLASVGSLLDRNRRFAFHHEEIKIFPQQNMNRLHQGADNSDFQVAHGVEHRQRPVLKYRIAIEDEQSCLHARRIAVGIKAGILP